jgi:chemotaxis protein histidine kinase CheA
MKVLTIGDIKHAITTKIFVLDSPFMCNGVKCDGRLVDLTYGITHDCTVSFHSLKTSQSVEELAEELAEEPAEEPAQPVEESVQPVEEPAQPAEEPAQPAEEPAQPVEEPAQPVEEQAQPVEEPAQPVEEAAPQESAEKPSPPASHQTVTTLVMIEGVVTPLENPADADVIRGPCDICRELCVPG